MMYLGIIRLSSSNRSPAFHLVPKKKMVIGDHVETIDNYTIQQCQISILFNIPTTWQLIYITKQCNKKVNAHVRK